MKDNDLKHLTSFTLYLEGSFISQKTDPPLRLLNMIRPKTCSCLISVKSQRLSTVN